MKPLRKVVTPARASIAVLVLLALGATACELLLGLEPLVVVPDDAGGDTGAGPASPDASCGRQSPPCGAFCLRQPSAPQAPLLYCNDFDSLDSIDASTLGFGRIVRDDVVSATFSVERGLVASAPNALLLTVEPATARVGLGGTIDVAFAPDHTQVELAVSYDPVDPDAGLPNRTIPLVALIVDAAGAAVVFGVDQDRYFISRTPNFLTISSSEVVAEAIRLDDALRPRPPYLKFVLSIEKTTCPTPIPDGGAAPGELSAFVRSVSDVAPFASSTPLACKRLPPFTPAPSTTVFIGGFVKDPVATMRWRFDDIVVRSRP